MKRLFPAAALLALALAACGPATVDVPGDGASSSSSSSARPAASSARSSSAAPAGPVTYESPQGFSVVLPASAWIAAGATAPVRAFEDPAKGRVFLATAAYDDPATPGSDRLPTTLEFLQGPNASWAPHWTMDVTEIADDEALAEWVRNHYGPGCTVAEKAETAQRDVFDVLLEGDGLPLDATRCPLNYAYEIRYQPAKGRVLSWELGQAPQFTAGDGETALDLEMRDSVRML